MAYPFETMQDGYFYGLLWPKSNTEALVTYLLTQKQVGHWVWNSNNGPTIMEAREFLNQTFHTDYTNIEVLARVKKLRGRYTLFSTMIAQSGVVWNRVDNIVYATLQQWDDWRSVYPMARAYMTNGEPLYEELKALFSPDDGAENDPVDDDDLIIIVDSDDEENMEQHPFQFVQALPAPQLVDIPLPVHPGSPDHEVIEISSDESNHSYHAYFDSDVEIDFSDDDEYYAAALNMNPSVGEVIDPVPIVVSDSSDDESLIPNNVVPIPSASLQAIRAAMLSIPQFPLRDGFTTSDDETE
ncbi:hypothetical protein ACS0TY_025277 [Phlomoides rotata]